METISFDQMYDYLADFFKTVEWSRETLTEVGNTLIQRTAWESNPEYTRKVSYDSRAVLEAKLHALYTLVQHHSDIAGRLDYTPLLPHIRTYDEECTDTVLYLLACTGDLRYMQLIEQEAARFPDIPLNEYRKELMFRAEKKA